MRAFHTTLLMTAVSGLALCAGVAHAAEPAAAAPEQVEDLVVTAQKREQKTVDVPIALTAYSGAMLERLGVQEFDKLSSLVPGFQVQNQSPNNPGFVMRGITEGMPYGDLAGYVENLERRLRAHESEMAKVYYPAAAGSLNEEEWTALEASAPLL